MLNMNFILNIPIFIHLLNVTGVLVISLVAIYIVTFDDSKIAKIAKIIIKILLCVSILAIIIKICFIPNYKTEAKVESVGGRGLTVSYVNSYGENTLTARINVNSVSEYNAGDTITIDVYDFWIKEAGRCE